MIAIPAVDLRGGACVQLVGGDPGDERVRRDDPVAVALEWRAAGFRRLHVVDLDAALGTGSNAPIVSRIVALGGSRVQVGGGLRTRDAIDQAVALGAAQVVVGTRALTDREFLEGIAEAHPHRIVVALDARDGVVVTHGWTRSTGRRALDVAREVAELPLGGLLVTAVEREGRLAGTDLRLMRSVATATATPLVASGGITTLADLRALADAGASAAVIGMALYTGRLDPARVAEEFSA